MGYRRYGPADYDPDPVPVWNSISRSIDGYGYQGYYHYGYYMDGYPGDWRLAPEMMQRFYVSDQLVQETTMAASEQLEEVAELMNDGIDAAAETVNEAVGATVEAANDMFDMGAEEISQPLNGALESVLSTKHGVRNDDAVLDREGEVHSTAHSASDRQDEPDSPVDMLNRGIDAALGDGEEEAEYEPGMLVAGAWIVGSGLADWAASVQNGGNHQGARDGVYSTAHESEHTGQELSADSRQSDMTLQTYSTAHTDTFRQVEDTLDLEVSKSYQEAPEGPSGGMALAFGESMKGYTADFQPGYPARQSEAQASRMRTPEEILALQEARYQQALDLVRNIDFSNPFQREAALGMGG